MVPVLAQMRLAGVQIALDGEHLSVSGTSQAQIEAIKADKPRIVATLRAEAVTGTQALENSALFAGISRSYKQVADCYEFGADRASCRTLIEAFDKLLELPYATASATYGKIGPELELLQLKINKSRMALLEGRELYGAATYVFKPQIPQPERKPVNANIFS